MGIDGSKLPEFCFPDQPSLEAGTHTVPVDPPPLLSLPSLLIPPLASTVAETSPGMIFLAGCARSPSPFSLRSGPEGQGVTA